MVMAGVILSLTLRGSRGSRQKDSKIRRLDLEYDINYVAYDGPILNSGLSCFFIFILLVSNQFPSLFRLVSSIQGTV